MSARTELAAIVADLRQPEYTGENRCLPCTVTNVVIATVAATALAVLFVTPVGILALLASLVAIYLRGYLVPGTPELTQEYFPPWLLAAFGKNGPVRNAFDVRERPTAGEITPASSPAVDDTDTPSVPEDADGPLFAAGVLIREEDNVVLAPAFRMAWRDRIDAARGEEIDPTAVRDTFDAETIRQTSGTSFVIDSNASVRWESSAALLADVTAAALLRERLAGWTEFGKDDRTATLTGLRLFLEHCPSCEGTIIASDDRVDPCCQKPHLVTSATCEECGSLIADAAVVDAGEDTPVRVRLLRV